MFKHEEREYLNNPDYSMALEKFFAREIYTCDDIVAENFEGDKEIGKNGVVDTAYAYTNEDLSRMFKYFKGCNKVLTIGSSGDQALMALYGGAKDVTVADVNLYTKYWIDYKIAAIKNLDYKTYIRTFGSLHSFCDMAFDYITFKKIFHDLDDDSATFWGTIFQEDLGGVDILTKLLGRGDTSFSLDVSCDFYNKKENFYKLKEILNTGDFDLKYENVEFTHFPYYFKDKYDTILLSNVCRYVGKKEYEDTVKRIYKNNLANGGKMQLHYIYDYDKVPSIKGRFEEAFPHMDIKADKTPHKEYFFIVEKPKVMEDEASM